MSQAEIAVINTIAHYPVPLTDRWGDYNDRSTLKQHWKALDGSDVLDAYALLHGRYNSGEMDRYGNPMHLSIGDPRAFQHEEVTFVAVREGRIGIHAEVELDVEFNDLDDPSEFEDEITRAEFDELASYYTEKLRGLADAYPKTQFFIAHGEEVTYKGRVTINAFTPLLNGRLPDGTMLAPQSLALMVSPYFRCGPDAGEINIAHCPCLVGLTDKLLDIALERQTDNANRTGH